MRYPGMTNSAPLHEIAASQCTLKYPVNLPDARPVSSSFVAAEGHRHCHRKELPSIDLFRKASPVVVHRPVEVQVASCLKHAIDVPFEPWRPVDVAEDGNDEPGQWVRGSHVHLLENVGVRMQLNGTRDLGSVFVPMSAKRNTAAGFVSPTPETCSAVLGTPHAYEHEWGTRDNLAKWGMGRYLWSS